MSDVNEPGTPFQPESGGDPALRRVGSNQEPFVQQPDGKPVVENPGLPHMEAAKVEQRRFGGELRFMEEVPGAAPAPSGRRMQPVPPDGRSAGVPATPRGPQQPAAAQPVAAGGESYLRLLLHVEDGELSVRGVSEVPGPLGDPEPLHGDLVYEVTVGSKQIAAGAVPDPGVRRSFPPLPDSGAPGVEGHHVVEVPSYDFTARVPAAEVSSANLPDVQVAIYRLEGGQVVQPRQNRPLPEQVGHLVQEVARLRGIHLEELPQDVRAQFDRMRR
jgi:hypothetical protein